MKNVILNLFKILLLLLGLFFLELNKNTIFGWLLTLILLSVYIFLYRTHKITDLILVPVCLLLFVLIVYISWPPFRFTPAVTNKNPKPSETVSTSYGKVRGVLNKDESVAVYAGIPYAKPPVGTLRFKEP